MRSWRRKRRCINGLGELGFDKDVVPVSPHDATALERIFALPLQDMSKFSRCFFRLSGNIGVNPPCFHRLAQVGMAAAGEALLHMV